MPAIIPQAYEVVAVECVQEHPENPNRGDEDGLDESLEANDFFGACVVQRSTGNILVGNHRHRRAVARGMEFIPVIWADVSDEHALRIMLADNAYGRRAHDDERALLAVLDSFARGAEDVNAALRGTGYDAEAYTALIERLTAEPVVPDFPPADDGMPAAEHRIEIECTSAALRGFQDVLDRWAEIPGVTVSIT